MSVSLIVERPNEGPVIVAAPDSYNSFSDYISSIYNSSFQATYQIQGVECDLAIIDDDTYSMATENSIQGYLKVVVSEASILKMRPAPVQDTTDLCQLCFASRDRAVMDCEHVFCKSCLKLQLTKIIREDLHQGFMPCPFATCTRKKIPDATCEELLEPELLQTFQQERDSRIVYYCTCPNKACQQKVTIAPNTKSTVWAACGFHLWNEWQQEVHEGRSCEDARIIRDIQSRMDTGREPIQWPRCRKTGYYSYVPDDTRLSIANWDQCGLTFLTCCAVYKSQVDAHGRSHHRPDCQHYRKSMLADTRDVNDFLGIWERCSELKILCPVPQILNHGKTFIDCDE